MDLSIYYARIREVQERIKDKDVVVVSCTTEDGGQAGIYTEVPNRLAAKMIVDSAAVLASDEEAMIFRQERQETKEKADQELAASRMPVTVVPTAEFKRLLAGQGRE